MPTSILYPRLCNALYTFLFCYLFSTLAAQITYINPIDFTASNPWFQPIKRENVKQIKALISAHTDLEACDEKGVTALMAATAMGNKEIMQLLIQAGAQVNAADENGNTPLLYAVYDFQKKDAVELLLKAGADCQWVNDFQTTPLILAAFNGHDISLQKLIQAGADLEYKGKDERTALMQAVDNFRIGAVQALARAKANLETRDHYSLTPLLLSAFKYDAALTKALIKLKCDLRARTTQEIPVEVEGETVYLPAGATALTIAQAFGSKGVIEALKSAGLKNDVP